MIPICKQQGCQIAKSGRPKCTHGCVLAKPERADARQVPQKPKPVVLTPNEPPNEPPKPKEVAPPKPLKEARVPSPKKQKALRTHLGTGVVVTLKTLPSWRLKPSVPEPWEKARCGTIAGGPMSTDPAQVNCESCLQAWASSRKSSP